MMIQMENKKPAESENASFYIQRIREKLIKLRLHHDLTFNHKDRRKLIKKVSDVDILKDVFENDSNWGCKLQALVNIKDQNYLAKVAKDKSIDFTFRKEAMDRIDDHDILWEVAYIETEEDLIKYLITKIKSKKLLAKYKTHLIKSKIFDGKNGSLLRLIDDRQEELENSLSFIFD